MKLTKLLISLLTTIFTLTGCVNTQLFEDTETISAKIIPDITNITSSTDPYIDPDNYVDVIDYVDLVEKKNNDLDSRFKNQVVEFQPLESGKLTTQVNEIEQKARARKDFDEKITKLKKRIKNLEEIPRVITRSIILDKQLLNSILDQQNSFVYEAVSLGTFGFKRTNPTRRMKSRLKDLMVKVAKGEVKFIALYATTDIDTMSNPNKNMEYAQARANKLWQYVGSPTLVRHIGIADFNIPNIKFIDKVNEERFAVIIIQYLRTKNKTTVEEQKRFAQLVSSINIANETIKAQKKHTNRVGGRLTNVEDMADKVANVTATLKNLSQSVSVVERRQNKFDELLQKIRSNQQKTKVTTDKLSHMLVETRVLDQFTANNVSIINIGNFAIGQTIIKSRMSKKITLINKAREKGEVEIVGVWAGADTDTGTSSRNQKLSNERAQKIGKALKLRDSEQRVTRIGIGGLKYDEVAPENQRAGYVFIRPLKPNDLILKLTKI